MNPDEISRALAHAVTTYDRKQEAKAKANPRAYYNHYALPQYLGRVADIVTDIRQGADHSAAVCAGFTPGPLRNACLKALGLSSSNVESYGNYKGMPVYAPVSKR